MNDYTDEIVEAPFLPMTRNLMPNQNPVHIPSGVSATTIDGRPLTDGSPLTTISWTELEAFGNDIRQRSYSEGYQDGFRLGQQRGYEDAVAYLHIPQDQITISVPAETIIVPQLKAIPDDYDLEEIVVKAKDALGHGSDKRGVQLSHEEFVAVVKDVAKAEDRGMGHDTVFIHHIFEGLQKKHPSLTREHFNHMLLEAHKQGHIHLSRADLPQALHPDDVRESEIKHGDLQLHAMHENSGGWNRRRKKRDELNPEWRRPKTYDEEQAERNQ